MYLESRRDPVQRKYTVKGKGMWAKKEIFRILTECNQRQGWQIPEYLVSYEADILAKKIDKNPWQPEPSYAERYLTAHRVTELLELAETCWFTRAVFPELGTRRGIKSSYYVQLGESCYDRAVKHLNRSNTHTLEQMQKNFEFLAESAYTAIRLNENFREMWDL